MFTSPSKPIHQRIHSTRLSASLVMLFRLDFKHRCGHELKRALNTLSPIAERANSPQRQMHTRFNQTKIGASACADVPMRTRYMSHKPEPIRRHHVPYCPCALYIASVVSWAPAAVRVAPCSWHAVQTGSPPKSRTKAKSKARKWPSCCT